MSYGILHCHGVHVTSTQVAVSTPFALEHGVNDSVASVLLCSLAVLNLRVGHTMDVLSPFIPVLCHSD